jgi:hypothetical protein
VSWSNWATFADLGTALGTLILAVATFSAVRSDVPVYLAVPLRNVGRGSPRGPGKTSGKPYKFR